MTNQDTRLRTAFAIIARHFRQQGYSNTSIRSMLLEVREVKRRREAAEAKRASK